MSNRSKGRTGRTGYDPDELDELQSEADARRASGSEEPVEAPLLAEGEPVGPWSDEEEEENAFDAAVDDVQADDDQTTGYQAQASESAPPRARDGGSRRGR